jgi:hypothetical protein
MSFALQRCLDQGTDLAEIPMSKQEFDRYLAQAKALPDRQQSWQTTRGYIDACRKGVDIPFHAIHIRIHSEKWRFSLEELGITKEELDRYYHVYDVDACKRILKDCQEGNNYSSALYVLQRLRQRKVTYEEIGTTPMRIQKYLNLAYQPEEEP